MEPFDTASLSRDLKERYDQILFGMESSFPKPILKGNLPDQVIRNIFQYAFEKVLKWDPYQVKRCISIELIHAMKLDGLYNLIPFPAELYPDVDVDYLACFLYPNLFPYDKKKHVIAVYKDVLSGKSDKFPHNFFAGETGEENFMICIGYALENSKEVQGNFQSLFDLYQFFSDKDRISAWLHNMKLSEVLLFFNNPIDMLDAYLKLSSDKNNYGKIYHQYFSFLHEMKETKEAWKALHATT